MAMSIGMKGYMLKQTASHITKKWQKRWFVLHNTSSDGVVRIEYYDDEAGEMADANKRTVVLRGFGDCRQLPGDKSHPYMFELTSQIGNHVFGCESWDEVESWMESIRAAVEDDKSKCTKKSGMSTMLGTDALGKPGYLDPSKPNMQPETNGATKPIATRSSISPQLRVELSRNQLQSDDENKQDPLSTNSPITSSAHEFSVTIKPNKDSKRLGFIGTYTFEVTPTQLRLLNLVGTIPITGWSYQELKNFSHGKDYFEIECGRSSVTGAGTFRFGTKEAKEVVRVIQHYIEKQLAEFRRPPSEGGPAEDLRDSPPLKSKCSAELTPPLKKAYRNYKPAVENDYGTRQDALGVVPVSAGTNVTYPELTKNTSTDALLSDVNTIEESEARLQVGTSMDTTGVSAVSSAGSMVTVVASNPAIDWEVFDFDNPMAAGYTPTPVEATGYTPVTPVGATGHTPATPVEATGYTPAIPVGATGYTPAIPVGAQGYTPAIPVGATSYTPAIPVGATGYTPAIPVGATSYTPAIPVGATPAIPVGATGHTVAIPFTKIGRIGEIYSVTVKQNKAAKMCGLTGASYNIEITATHFRVLEPDSPIPIMGWTFQELKYFTVEKDSFIIDVGDTPGVVAGKYIFNTDRSKELLRAVQQSIQQQIWAQTKGRQNKLEGNQSLPTPEEGFEGPKKDSSVGGSSASSQEDSSSLTHDDTADSTAEAADKVSTAASATANALTVASTATARAAGVSDDTRGQRSIASKIFPVTLKQNKAAKLFGLTGEYNLEIAPTFIRLMDPTSLVPIVVWTLTELQSYKLGKESIEVVIGQASGISAGIYEFKTKSHKEVFRALEQSIHRLLYELKTNPPPPPLPPPRPKQKQPAQEMDSPAMKDVSSGKLASSSQDTGHETAAVQNVYDSSPLPLQQQGGSVSNEVHHAEGTGSINVTSSVPASPETKLAPDQGIEVCTVILKQNASAISAGLVGTYNLEITPTEVRLLEINQTVPIVVWTYQEIKSFSTGKNTFTLEVGRRAQTGPGEFVFSTKCSEEVHKVIEYNIAQQLRDYSIGQDVRNHTKTQPTLQATASDGGGSAARNYHHIDSIPPTENKFASIERDNIPSFQTFTVTLKKNKSATSSGLVGTYNLEVTPTEVKLVDINQTEPTVVWAYQEIRAFTVDTNVFSFEVGRKSQTGEGKFVFNTKNAEELYKVIEYHVERQLRDETIGKEVRNRVRAKPVHHQVEFSEETEESTSVGVAGKYRLIETDTFEKKPSITEEKAEQLGKYHQLDDSLPIDSVPDSRKYHKLKDSLPIDNVPESREYHQLNDSLPIDNVPESRKYHQLKDSLPIDNVPESREYHQLKDSLPIDNVPESREYHKLNDSLPIDNVPESSITLEQLWAEIDANTNPYGEVMHLDLTLANSATTNENEDIGACSNATYATPMKFAPLLRPEDNTTL